MSRYRDIIDAKRRAEKLKKVFGECIDGAIGTLGNAEIISEDLGERFSFRRSVNDSTVGDLESVRARVGREFDRITALLEEYEKEYRDYAPLPKRPVNVPKRSWDEPVIPPRR